MPAMTESTAARASTPTVKRDAKGKWLPGVSGHPGGDAARARKALNAATIAEMHRAFREGGRAAIDKVMKQQPAVFLKLLVLLVPREMEVSHKGGVKSMTDEELERGIEAIQTMLAARAGEAAKVIEGTAEPAALPAPNGPSPEAALETTLEPTKRKPPNRLMIQADTAVGPRERTTRKSPPGR
jgi:hypothetical protein